MAPVVDLTDTTEGNKPITPIVSGSICGGFLFILWSIGFAIYFRKRYKRKKRKVLIAAGKAVPRKKDLEIPKDKVIIPPDPAVLFGQRQPGECAFPKDEVSNESHSGLPSSVGHVEHANSKSKGDSPSSIMHIFIEAPAEPTTSTNDHQITT